MTDADVLAKKETAVNWCAHAPKHVHVYRDDKLVVKWDLDNEKAMKGSAPQRVLDLIAELEAEGLL